MTTATAKKTKVTASVYQISNAQWVVGVFGDVAIGNGRTTFGYIRETKCADRECAENLAKFITR